MKKILLTGFDPFHGQSINPSWELVKPFDKTVTDKYTVFSRQLPTVFKESASLLKDYISEINPDIVICFGQAGSSTGVRLERIALNLDDARLMDNKGNRPIDEIIIENAPLAYSTLLPIKKIKDEIDKALIPCELSLTCGTFVCNHIFYHLMHYIEDKDIIGGFIHVPFIPEQNREGFSMELTTLQAALKIILDTVVKNAS